MSDMTAFEKFEYFREFAFQPETFTDSCFVWHRDDTFEQFGKFEPLLKEIWNRRILLRTRLLSEENIDREQAISDFDDWLKKFLWGYFKAIREASTFSENGLVWLGCYLNFYSRYLMMEPYLTGTVYEDVFPFGDGFNLCEYMKSDWPVVLLEVDRPLEDTFEVRRVLARERIQEIDWDGDKVKTGIEILRRNGECCGTVYVFVYPEITEEEGKAKLTFYSISTDGKEFRCMIKYLRES